MDDELGRSVNSNLGMHVGIKPLVTLESLESLFKSVLLYA